MPSDADPLAPPPRLLAKVGSILVHVEEMLSPQGHRFDRAALEATMNDPEVKEWLEALDKLALVPKKR